MDLFGIDGDHRGGRRRWTAIGWPLLGALIGALLGVLLAPTLAQALGSVLPTEAPWLLPALVLLSMLATAAAFIVLGRRNRG